jgi:hypothetical protein
VVDYIRGNPGLKSANVEEMITRDELNNRINEITRCKKDPVYFANKYFTIISPKHGKHIIQTYKKQNEMLETFVNNNRVVCCASRQIGKCVGYFTWITIRNKNVPWLKFKIPIGIMYSVIKLFKSNPSNK